MIQEEDPKRLIQIALVALLIVGCIAVLMPFTGTLLFAVVIWICTWPLYASKLLPRLGGRNTLGASLMTLLLILVMLVPTGFLAGSLASGVETLIAEVRPHVQKGPARRAACRPRQAAPGRQRDPRQLAPGRQQPG